MEIPPLIKGQKCVLLTAFRSSGAHIALRWEDGNSEERNRRPPVSASCVWIETNRQVHVKMSSKSEYVNTFLIKLHKAFTW